MAVLLRLWLIASVCWGGLIYWAFSTEHEPGWQGFAFGPPLALLALGAAIRWAFSAYRAGN